MNISDKDYFWLSLLAESGIPNDCKTGTVREILERWSRSDAWNDSFEPLLEQSVREEFGTLELTEWQQWDHLEAWLLRKGDVNILVCAVIGDGLVDVLRFIVEGHPNVPDLLAVANANSANGRLIVTGHSLGGAAAVHVAAKAGLNGVVFDAPGIGKRLAPNEKSAVQVVNYLTGDSVISAVGEQVGRMVYAKGDGRMPFWTEQERKVQGKYEFDSRGNVLPGERGVAFTLFTKLNQLLEANTQAFEDVASVFADVTDCQEAAADQAPYVLPIIVASLRKGQLSEAADACMERMNRAVDSMTSEQIRSMREWTRQGLTEEAQTAIAKQAEAAMLQAADTVQAYFRSLETVVAVLTLCEPEQDFTAEIEGALDRFGDAVEQKLKDVSRTITQVLDRAVEALLDSYMPKVDWKLEI